MKKFTSVFLALMLVIALCACGASAKNVTAVASEPMAPMAAPAAVSMSDAMAAGEIYYDNGGGFAVEAPAPEPREEESVSGSADKADINPDKIIYSASATVETTDFEGTLAGVDQLVKAHGGFIESSSINGSNFYNKSRGYSSTRSAYYTIRIPSAEFSTVMNSLSTLGNVPYSNTYTDNISGQYYDTQSRLNAYKTQEQSLLRLMEKAESVDDIIAIEEKLTEIRYSIESLQTTLNRWDRQVNYSTIDLSVNEVQEYTPQTEPEISYGRQLVLSLRDGLKAVADFFKGFLVWFLGALPTLTVLAVLAAVILPLTKKAKAKRKAKKEAKKAEKAENSTKE